MATPSRPEIVTDGGSPVVMVVAAAAVVVGLVVTVVLAVVVELGSNWGRIGNGYEGSVFL